MPPRVQFAAMALLLVGCATASPDQPVAQQVAKPRPSPLAAIRQSLREAVTIVDERPTKRIAFEGLVVTAQPTIGVLHHSLDGFDLPPGGMVVKVTCMVDLAYGRIGGCEPREGGKSPDMMADGSPLKAAAMRMGATRVQATPGLADTDALALIDVDVRLSPSDRVQTGTPVNVRKTAEIDWVNAPRNSGLFSFFNLSGLQRPVTLTTTCQIQADLSFVCTQAKFDPPGDVVERDDPFVFARGHASRPTLKDGSPAPGTWVAIEYKLEPTPMLISRTRANPPPATAN